MLTNKTWLAVLAAATTVFSSISADFWNNGGQNCGTPCCNPCDSGSFGIRADFLYWQAREEGLEVFGTEAVAPIAGAPAPFVRFDRIGFPKNSKWDPGFRVGLSYESPCNGWGADVLYTRFNTTSKRSFLIPDDITAPFSVILPSLFPSATGQEPFGFGPGAPVATSLLANSSWKLNYNVVDITFGKDYGVNSCAHLKPYFGVRGAWINQKYDRDYLFNNTLIPPDALFQSTLGDSKYSAAGIVVGTDASLNIGGGFGVYGNFLGSLLYGKYRIKEANFITSDDVITVGATSVTSLLNRDYFKVRANLEASAGIQYRFDFDCSNQSLLVRAGYEVVYWFGQNQFRLRPIIIGSDQSDLWFQGLTVTAKYNF